ncbi:MAG TPA: PAS domain S-box protein, partial [Mariprofundaceae bacterium]|nr:PAS domain S-box protein [Mariprofundaceae bacterium]
LEVTQNFRNKAHSLPLPITLHSELSEKMGAEHFGTHSRIYSDYPFPRNKEGGVKDTFERDALAALSKSPGKPFYRVEGEDDGRILRFAKADIMRQSCIGCHNSSPESPKRDWKVGDLAGVLSISVPISSEHRLTHGKFGAGYVLVGVLLTFLIIAFYIANSISHASIQNLEEEVRNKITELEEAEESLDSAQKIGRVGNWAFDLESKRFWASDGLLRVLGISKDEFDGTMESLLKHLHRDDRVAFQQSIERTNSGEKHGTIDYRIVLPSGEMRYLHEEADVVVNEAGDRRRLIGVVQDVTEKKERQLKLNMLSNALEQAGEAVLITDSSNHIRYVNKTFTTVTGYRLEEVIGKNPKILSSGRQSKAFYQKMWEEIRVRGVWKGRIYNRRKNGDVYPEQIHIRAIRNDEGEVINYAAVFSDITENIKLEHRLRESQKMEAVGTLVGGIAHDFNNILAAITGNLYLIKKDVEGLPEVIEKIETIEDESFRAADMIAQLLTFARKDVVHMEEISISELFKTTFQLTHVTVPESVILEWNDPAEELRVKGDENQIKQIILNLINNARDALEGLENPEIRVSLNKFMPDTAFTSRHPTASFEAYACIEVEDNGAGIARDTMSHIFEPFYTTKSVGKGTGLGLAMVYGSIQQHGGIIEVDSELNKGSRFRIYLPLIDAGKPKSLEEDAWSGVALGSGETILVVDDEDVVRSVARDLLRSVNYKVLEAADGMSAIDVFKANRVDIGLVILDVVMPRMGGVQAAEVIRSISPDIPIIFATGYDQDRVLESVADWSNVAVLSKPYRAREISMKIRKMIG